MACPTVRFFTAVSGSCSTWDSMLIRASAANTLLLALILAWHLPASRQQGLTLKIEWIKVDKTRPHPCLCRAHQIAVVSTHHPHSCTARNAPKLIFSRIP